MLVMAVPSSFASVRVDLNISRVKVSDQSEQSQKEAIRQALAGALIKLTGNPAIVDEEAAKYQIRNASQLLRSYRYEMRGGQLFYVAEFDQQKLMSFVRNNNFPVWGEVRPDTLIWLATENRRGERHIIDEAESNEITSALREVAELRGLSVSLPLMDLTDNDAIRVYDIWGQFTDTLRRASARYGADNIIAARLYQYKGQDSGTPPGTSEESDLADETDENYQEDAPQSAKQGDYVIDWVLISREGNRRGALAGNNAETVTRQFLNQYASQLAGRFAVLPSEEDASTSVLTISVANVNSLEKYIHASRYIQGLSVVEKAMVTEQKGSVAKFSLVLHGTEEDLMNTLSLESQLQPVKDAFGQPLPGLNFYWAE